MLCDVRSLANWMKKKTNKKTPTNQPNNNKKTQNPTTEKNHPTNQKHSKMLWPKVDILIQSTHKW